MLDWHWDVHSVSGLCFRKNLSTNNRMSCDLFDITIRICIFKDIFSKQPKELTHVHANSNCQFCMQKKTIVKDDLFKLCKIIESYLCAIEKNLFRHKKL